MSWIESDGGPLIVLQQHQVASWDGTGNGYWEPGMGTDYDRACNVADWLGVVDVAHGTALVLGGDPLPTRAVGVEDGLLLVRWIFAPDGWDVESLDVDTIGAWQEPVKWRIESSPQVLQDSAYPGGSDETARVWTALSPGLYDVLTADYSPSDELRLIVHWMRPSSEQ